MWRGKRHRHARKATLLGPQVFVLLSFHTSSASRARSSRLCPLISNSTDGIGRPSSFFRSYSLVHFASVRRKSMPSSPSLLPFICRNQVTLKLEGEEFRRCVTLFHLSSSNSPSSVSESDSLELREKLSSRIMAVLARLCPPFHLPAVSSPCIKLSAPASATVRCVCQEGGVATDTPTYPRRAVLQIPLLLGGLSGIELVSTYSANAEDAANLPITKKVFMDIAIDGQPAGQIVIGLFGATAPIGAQRFAELVAGKRGVGYRRKEFYKITKNYIQNVGVRLFSLTGGVEDVAKFTGGDTAEALIEEMVTLEEKKKRPKHFKGAVSLVAIDSTKPPPKTKLVAKDGTFVIVEEAVRPDPNGTEFMISTSNAPELDNTNTVVGQVIQGWDVIERIANVKVVQENTNSPYFQVAKLIGDSRAVVAEKGFNRPYAKVTISKCGEVR